MNSAKIMAKELVRVRKQREQLLSTKVKIGQVAARTEVLLILTENTHLVRVSQQLWQFRTPCLGPRGYILVSTAIDIFRQ